MPRLHPDQIEALHYETLVVLAEEVAEAAARGPLTLLRLGRGWKVTLGTPDHGAGRAEIDRLPAFGTANEALFAFICGRAGPA